MTRFDVRPLSLVMFACVAICAQPALAVVNTSGDVRPSATPFGVIFVDDDGDFFSDVISPEGNTVAYDLADPFDPMGGNGNGLAWNNEIIWRNYESSQNILVGETASGSLTINGGSALRYRHLVLGGASTDTGNGDLELTAQPGSGDFELQEALSSRNELSSGYGVMTVTGFGSVFNNDPQVIETQYSTALIQAGATAGDIPAIPDPGARIVDEGFDAYVGLSGGGELNVTAGGRVEIQDSLIVGLGQSASGTVNVDGSGSHLMAFGRDDFDPSGGGTSSTATNDVGSVIGGFGSGSLNITNGGRASFFNGLSLGASNGNTGAPITGTGSGTVILEGTGSTLNAYASRAMISPTSTDRFALAIGELRNTNTDVNPIETYGDGRLQIGVGGTVNATFDAGYNTSNADANAEIGLNGTLEMQGGQLLVGNSLINDGTINGYGYVRSYQMVNTTYATIDGGDGANGPLQIQINSGTTDPGSADFAFENLGEIKGNIDITVQGGFGNGDNNTSGSNGGVIRATGKIHSGTFFNRPNAQLTVGPGQSLSLLATAINSATDATLQEGNGGIGNPVVSNQSYYQANLGSISVDDGLLELGRLVTTGGGSLPANNTDRFRNARQFNRRGNIEVALGTINSNDGELIFKTGLFNTGIVAFTGGDNLVRGEILNGAEINYDPGGTDFTRPGIILISGDATTVTFEDNVDNEGIISVGPTNSIANFLGDLSNSGTLQVAVDPLGNFARSAAIVVGQDVMINSGSTMIVNFISAVPVGPGFSVALLTAGGALDEASLFSNLVLPDLPEGQFWDVIYDTALDQIRLEIIESLALGGDFSGDGVVNSADIAIWVANVGILSGASAIQGDADLDGDVDQNDYLVLMEQIYTGVPVLVGGGGGGGTPIPEPSTALLALMASAALVSRRR